MVKESIFNYNREQLEEILIKLEEKIFHAGQIFSWLYKNNLYDFALMSNLSKSLQGKLAEKYDFGIPKISKIQTSSDNTIKMLIELRDGNLIETVLMPYEFGTSICISSQVGCNMGCAFCASGLNKKLRNLEPYEMIGQIICANEYLKGKFDKVNNVVVMGTGEPLDNYQNILTFLDIIADPLGLEFGARKITISTCGVAPRIKEFALLQKQVNLAISLHATTDKIRDQLVPVNRVYPLKVLMEAIDFYQSCNKRKVTIEYILIDGINDSLVDAERLRRLLSYRKGQILINLIPLNEVSEKPYKKSTRVNEFYDYLKKKRLNVTIRKEFGKDIDAACGQLRNKYEGRNAD